MFQEGEVSVMFELIGAGEATIDEIRLSLWDPQPPSMPPMLRPIAEIPSNESTRR